MKISSPANVGIYTVKKIASKKITIAGVSG